MFTPCSTTPIGITAPDWAIIFAWSAGRTTIWYPMLPPCTPSVRERCTQEGDHQTCQPLGFTRRVRYRGRPNGVEVNGVGGSRRIADASAIHRRCTTTRSRRGDNRAPPRAASPLHRRCGKIHRPHLLRPHLGGLQSGGPLSGPVAIRHRSGMRDDPDGPRSGSRDRFWADFGRREAGEASGRFSRAAVPPACRGF